MATLAAALALSAAGRVAHAQNVQPGDRLVVRIFGGEQLIVDTLTVSDNGVVVLPKLGQVTVSAFPIPQLPDSLRARYARYLRNPTVDVVVLRRVIVNGEVRKPDIYYIDVRATLPDAIAHAGGLTEIANAKDVSIRRAGQITKVPDWQTSGSSIAQLQSGDQIYVGRRSWLSQNFLAAASTLAVLTSIFVSLRR